MFVVSVIRFVLRLFLAVMGSHKVTGRENVPVQGPYIVVVNHMSATDAPLLYLCLPRVKLRFFAGEKWEKHFFFGPMLRLVGAVYIDRYNVDRKALREALDALADGSVFGLAPEGTRSRTRQMIPAKEGAAYLASRAGVPILPVGVVNTDLWSSNLKRLRRTPFECHFGEPFVLPDLGHRAKGEDLAAYTHLIMAHIAALLPARYHGYYKDSPALAALLRGEDPWPYCYELAGPPVAVERPLVSPPAPSQPPHAAHPRPAGDS